MVSFRSAFAWLPPSRPRFNAAPLFALRSSGPLSRSEAASAGRLLARRCFGALRILSGKRGFSGEAKSSEASTHRRKVLFPRSSEEVSAAVQAVLKKRSLDTPSPLLAFLMGRDLRSSRRVGGLLQRGGSDKSLAGGVFLETANVGASPSDGGGAAVEGVRLVGLDCEGVRLGRFGRLSLLQLYAAAGGPFCFVDALQPSALRSEALTRLLEEDAVLKVRV